MGSEKRPFLFIIDFEMKRPHVIPLDQLDDDILYNINGQSNFNNYKETTNPIDYKCIPYPKEKYFSQFEAVLDEINYGNSFLLNLTARHQFISNESLKKIFLLADAKYKLYYKNEFIVFSPESFVRIKKGIISSYPMKGTIDAGIPNAEQIILDDKKEKAEHNTIVDLIRNDLSLVSKNVTVNRFRYIDKILTSGTDLLQVSSEITGELPDEYQKQIGDIIFKLLPAGSISGAPKKKTVEIIKANEATQRGYYTGIAGIFNGYELDSFVMIRFIENEGGHKFYYSGGGITSLSDPESEYDEMIKKVYVPTH